LGWAGNAVLFFPFKIMGNMVLLSKFSLSDPFLGLSVLQTCIYEGVTYFSISG
jgi:hypothetical protein